ncbi:hypothetical protein Tco_1323816, partial [Tanacetum coccineum]
PIYRRRDNGYIVEKGGIALDNRYVVPYNSLLLKRYQAHINVEWCNQSGAIKYLFKYINKGPDRVTAAVYEGNKDDSVHGTEAGVDEIKEYYNCRYISACEATWRIFSFDIHYRYPSVERLSFHLPGEQNIVYEDDADLCDVLNKPTVGSSMFMAWMERNKVDAHARTLTYVEFPTSYHAMRLILDVTRRSLKLKLLKKRSKWAMLLLLQRQCTGESVMSAVEMGSCLWRTGHRCIFFMDMVVDGGVVWGGTMELIIMANIIPPDHVDDLPVVEPNQPDVVPVIPEPVLVDEDEDPKEEEFEEEEEPQEEEDMDIDDEEDKNEPELTFSYEEADPLNSPLLASDSEPEDAIEVEDTVEPEDDTVPASVHEVGESSMITNITPRVLG